MLTRTKDAETYTFEPEEIREIAKSLMSRVIEARKFLRETKQEGQLDKERINEAERSIGVCNGVLDAMGY